MDEFWEGTFHVEAFPNGRRPYSIGQLERGTGFLLTSEIMSSMINITNIDHLSNEVAFKHFYTLTWLTLNRKAINRSSSEIGATK